MEVALPSSTMDFDFNSTARSSPGSSTPSTPKAFGNYFHSAPTSPAHASQFYLDFDDFSVADGSPASESIKAVTLDEKIDDFAFDFSEQLEMNSLSADELFDGGKIRPLKPPRPPRSVLGNKADERTADFTYTQSSTKSSRSESPKLDSNVESRGRERRERGQTLSSSNSGRRSARSLSPHRVSAYPWEEDQSEQLHRKKQASASIPKPSASSAMNTANSMAASSSSKANTSKRWKLKDLLLFRSASEGRATEKDPFRKYSASMMRKQEAEVKTGSFRSKDRVRRGPVSAHELHYTANKSASEDMKRRSFLPYKEGILGRLAFNPAVHALAHGFGSLYRS